MRCSFCQRELEEGAKKCPSCLHEITTEQPVVLPIEQSIPEPYVTRIDPHDEWHFDITTRNIIVMIYVSSLVGLVLPFGNIIAPYICMKKFSKEYGEDIILFGIKLINFQFAFSLFYYIALVLLIVEFIIYGMNAYAMILSFVSLAILAIDLVIMFFSIFKIYTGQAYTFPISFKVLKDKEF